jgi:hypothetical protein
MPMDQIQWGAMETRKVAGPEFSWTMLACGLALALAPLDWPYGYYQFLRLGVTAAAIWLAIIAERQQCRGWAIFGVGLALLFNPVFPVYLNRGGWLVIDLVVAGLCFVAAVRLSMK